MTITTDLIAANAEKGAFSSSLLSSMVIFQDPIYLIIATIGAFVSMGSAYYDFSKMKQKKEINHEKCTKTLGTEMLRAFTFGAIITVLSFMLFTRMDKNGFNALNIPFLNGMLPSFWFIITLIIATESVTIWVKIKAKITRLFL